MSGGRRAGEAGRGLALALLLGLLGAGCGGDEAPLFGPVQTPPPDATYTTRGLVRGLPGPPTQELQVFHEAVPEFVDRQGERSGMDSMTMPFRVKPGLSLDGIAVGDKVEMTFELRWSFPSPLIVTAIRELPPETELQLGSGPAPAATPHATADPDAADGAVSQGSSEAI